MARTLLIRSLAMRAKVCLVWPFLLAQGLVWAQLPPELPCGREAVPTYPELSSAPLSTFWSQSALGSTWKPPPCTGWTTEGFASLVTIVARFHAPSGSEGLLRRVGAISQLSGMRYWSTTHHRWQTLIVDAYALTGPQGKRRGDFTPDEMKPGALLYFEQVDNLSGKATYRLRIAEAADDRIVIDIENVTTMRYLLLTLFRPGELQSIYFLDRDSDDAWRYYAVTRTGRNASSLTIGKPASSINRAAAFFRHLAGLPTDLEPPVAR